MLDRKLLEIDALEAAGVDRRHALARRIDALAEGMDAAGRAEMMLDDVLVERVDLGVLLGSEETEVLARHEPEERSLARADGAIAGHHLLELAFDLELHACAMAAALVFHSRLLRKKTTRSVSSKPSARCTTWLMEFSSTASEASSRQPE